MLIDRAFQRRQRGASLVELALVLFILLMILAGIVDFGRVFNHYVVITNASREGARYGARFAPPQENVDEDALRIYRDGILAAVEGEVAQSSVDPDQLAIEVAPDPDPEGGSVAPAGEAITVTVSYTVPTIIADIAGFGLIPLRAQTAMVVTGLE